MKKNLEVLEIVESGSEEFVNKKYDEALSKFKLALKILENLNSENKENVQYMVQYLLSITLLEFNKLQDLLEALEILINLEKSMESKYPIVYNGLAKAYIKLYRFNSALNEIKRGFDIINKGIHFETFTVPLTCIEKETTKDGLLLSLLELREIASKWCCPDAKCALENCQNVIPHCPISRDIYFSDPSFTGFVNVICNNKHIPCTLKYHPDCWKFTKHNINSSQEFSDLDMLGHLCLKTNCTNTQDICIIIKIEIYNHEAKIIETIQDSTLLNLSKCASPVSKGAIKKKKPIPSIPPELLEVAEKKTKKISERKTSLKKLMELRKSYFGPLVNAEYQIDFENKKIEDANHFHRFLLEILYEYIKSKMIVRKKKLISKWHETKLLFADIPEIQTILDINIINLLLKHTKLIMVGNFICIPEVLGQVLQMFENEIIESYNILTNEIFEIEGAQSAIDNTLSDYYDENEEDSDTEEKSLKELFQVSDNSPDSSDKNSNSMNLMNSDDNRKKDIYKKLSFIPSENEYLVNNNYAIINENLYAIEVVHDDKSNDQMVYEKSQQNVLDLSVQKYFNNPLEKFHPNNLSTILINILSNEDMTIHDKQTLLEQLYFSVIQDTIKTSQEYMNEENFSISKPKKVKQNWSNECKKVQSETVPLETIQDEQHYQLLLKNQNKKIKVLKSERQQNIEILKKLDNRINRLNDELNGIHKGDFALRKENALKSLELKYCYNKLTLHESLNYTHSAVTVLTKINNLIKSYCGLNIDSEFNEWSAAFNQTLNAIQELQLEYVRVKSWIESINEDENLSNTNINYVPPPPCPTKSFSSIASEAFTALYKNTTNLSPDLSELLSILLSYSTSDISELIPPHLSTLKKFLLNKKSSRENTNDKLIEARDNVKKIQNRDLKKLSETIENFNQLLLSYDIKQLEPENTETEDALTNYNVDNNNVLEISNDNKPILGTPIKIASNLFMKREDSSTENKTLETSNTTIKNDNTNIEGKNKETKIDRTDELMNILLKNNDHRFESLNVKFDKKSSISNLLLKEFIKDSHKIKGNVKNIIKKEDEDNLSTDSNNPELSSISKDTCSFI